jgi:RimJ/RimL family protein N-acetyltransferase
MQKEQHTNTLGQIIGHPVTGWTSAYQPVRKVLLGRFCRLEPLNINKHAKELHAANVLDQEGRSWTYLPYGPFHSFAAYRDWLEHFCVHSDPLFFTIISNESGKAVGLASYLRIDPVSGSIEIGHLNFSALMKRTTIATEAMWLMIKEAFELGYRRCEWKCNALNMPSRYAAQRLGFSYEGVFRQATVIKGHNRDTAWYAAIDQEWPALNNTFERWLSPDNFTDDGSQLVSLTDLTKHLLVQRG